MGRKLYVGNLPYDIDESELKLAFTQCGPVQEVTIIADRESGRSRGFGFVTMADEDGARSALTVWSGKSLGGRPLVVKEAQERVPGAARPQPRQEAGRRQPGGHSPPPKEGRRERRERQGRDDYG